MSREKGFGHACGVRVHRVQKVQRVQRGRFLGLTGPIGRRVLKFDGAFGPEGCGGGSAAGCVEGLHRFAQGATALRAEGDGGALRAQIIKKPAPIPVISTEAERSGEISRLNSPGSMEAGDLSTQSIIKAFSSAPYRHAAPLEMTVAAGTPIVMLKKRCSSAMGHTFGGHVHIEYHNHSYPRPPLRHFVALFP